MNNPLIDSFDKGFPTPDQAVPFTSIKAEHFLPALKAAELRAREALKHIKSEMAPANFENTIVRLETCAEGFEQVSAIYHNLFGAEGTPEIQALAQEMSSLSAAFASEVSLDGELFQRVKSVYDRRNEFHLNAEQSMLLEKSYRSFVRNGALLSASDKEKLRAIDQELAKLAPLFSEHVLKATNAFEMWIMDKKDLEGLPDGAVEAAASEAERKGRPGQWVFTLHQPSFQPFLKYGKNRELRKKLFLAYGSRSFNDSYDNQGVIKDIVKMRQSRAQLLGFSSHADFVLQERMAENPNRVFEFLDQLYSPSHKAAERELQEVRDFAKQTDGISELMSWDLAYYSEKLREKKYNFNSEDLRPYFPLERVVEGVFEHARRLYGLTFKERSDIPVYHPEVKAFEVREDKSQNYVGLLYADFFPRETKRGGAWMTVFREQGLQGGEVKRPHVSIVCNFTRPTPTKPSLLSYDEVTTLFHEFGHALHGLLSKCHFRSIAGTNVYWDFVELPSQVMENWARERQGLDLFARHYQTGALIPDDLFARMKKAEKFMAGYNSLRQISFGFLDMGWHSVDKEITDTVPLFESKLLAKTQLLPVIPEVNLSCSFSHIFAGGYSAGYYSYKWAEVLDADAFEAFKEKGLFDRDVASRFLDHVLSRGGSEHPMTLYKRFRGREPDPQALLRKHGLEG